MDKRMKKKGASGIILITGRINFFFLALMNSTHLSIDVYCSNEAKKNRFSSITGVSF